MLRGPNTKPVMFKMVLRGVGKYFKSQYISVLTEFCRVFKSSYLLAFWENLMFLTPKPSKAQEGQIDTTAMKVTVQNIRVFVSLYGFFEKYFFFITFHM